MKLKIPREIKVGVQLDVETNGKKLTRGQSSKDREELSKIFSGEDFKL
jgi:hypothetical protein